VERVLVNPAIKKALCRDVKGDRSWLSKIRPVYGHNYHFHIRIGCPAGQDGCKAQPATPTEEGCGADLDAWFKKVLNPVPGPGRPPLKMSALPAACRQVLLAD
jgi:penicillin-insensitive murein endopeptidase